MSEEKQTVCGAISKVTSAQRDAERHHIVQVSFQEGIRGTITFLEEKIFRYDVSREGSVSEYAAPRDEAHTAKIQQRPDSSDAYMKPESEVTEDPVSVCIRCKETCIVFEKETGRMTIYVGKRKFLKRPSHWSLRGMRRSRHWRATRKSSSTEAVHRTAVSYILGKKFRLSMRVPGWTEE